VLSQPPSIRNSKQRKGFNQHYTFRIGTDYWRRAQKRKKPRLVEVTLDSQPPAGFALVLANGRRIETSWRFAEADLLRLIRAAEA
jgi:hypothetical protein